MLPGIRFLFATVLLSVSVLVFGLGAAALLRAAHDDFANLPPAQVSREAKVAHERDARQATLALLRVEMIADQDSNVEKMAAASAVAPVHAAEPADKPVTPEAIVPGSAADVTPVAPAPQSDAIAPVATEPVVVAKSEPPAADPQPTVVAAANSLPPVPDAPPPVASTTVDAAPKPDVQAVTTKADVQVAGLADPAAVSAELPTPSPVQATASKPVAKSDAKSDAKSASTAAGVAKPAHAQRKTIQRRKVASRGRARAVQVMQQQVQPNDPFAGFGTQRTAGFPR